MVKDKNFDEPSATCVGACRHDSTSRTIALFLRWRPACLPAGLDGTWGEPASTTVRPPLAYAQ